MPRVMWEPFKQETLNQSLFTAGALSSTLAQHSSNIGLMWFTAQPTFI